MEPDTLTQPLPITDPRFRYVAAVDTNLQEKFADVFAANALRRMKRNAELARMREESAP